MKKTTRQMVYRVLFVAGLICVAVFCHILSHMIEPSRTARLLDFTRTFLYLSLFLVWGVSVSQRITQTYVRRYLHLIALLMVFWLVLRELKFRFVAEGALMRELWYLYYIPILLIPLFTFFVSLSLEKPEQYRPPGWTGVFLAFDVFLITIVLTNDFHQWVFRFPADRSLWSENTNEYNILYYITVFWILLCVLLAFFIMLSKLKTPQGRKNGWLPLLPFCLILTYSILYYLRIPFLRRELNDFTVIFCLSVVGFLEACIWCGLIPSNTLYPDLFHTMPDTPVQIMDRTFRVHATSDHEELIDAEWIQKARSAPVIVDQKRLLHCSEITGGYVVFSENISEILSRKEMLMERQKELLERNALLQCEYDREKEYLKIREQNRLYDLLQKKTQKQIDRIDALSQCYPLADSAKKQRDILAHIVVLGTFIKRRRDFVLSGEHSDKMAKDMLVNALQESFHALRLFHIRGGFLVETPENEMAGSTLTLAYDFFEQVIETVLEQACFVNARFCVVNSLLRANIITDYTGNCSGIASVFPDIRIAQEADGTEFILTLEGGGTL